MTNRRPTTRGGWWRLLLAALAALVIGLVGAGTASAAPITTPQTRVGASTLTSQIVVGVNETVWAGQRWVHAPPHAQIVSATGVAAKGGANAVADVGDVLKGLPKGRSAGVRTVGSDQELGEVYGTLSRGGTPVEVPGYKGSWVELPDGTRVGIREASKSGGRPIDIKLPDGTTQKVHIDG